jgi:hypothetical protein
MAPSLSRLLHDGGGDAEAGGDILDGHAVLMVQLLEGLELVGGVHGHCNVFSASEISSAIPSSGTWQGTGASLERSHFLASKSEGCKAAASGDHLQASGWQRFFHGADLDELDAQDPANGGGTAQRRKRDGNAVGVEQPVEWRRLVFICAAMSVLERPSPASQP